MATIDPIIDRTTEGDFFKERWSCPWEAGSFSCMERKKVELLAPAGSPEGFYGAISAGADAVYLGGTKFGARAYAENFTKEELVGCIRYAHLFGRKVYLTVNILIKDSELEELYEYLLPYYEAGLDGVIVQDFGAFLFLREHFPGLKLHASTQMTLTGPWGAGYLKDLGVERIVPARELSLEELKRIKEKTGLELEVFVHGAMCYCYSGQCLFSSLLGGRSGNRGRCAQPCRLPYSVEMQEGGFPARHGTQEKPGSHPCDTKGRTRSYPFGAREKLKSYPLSLKDLCTIDCLPKLIEAGMDSFKIEGRMKKPEYAAGVTAIYRKYLDLYYDLAEKGPENLANYRVSPEDREFLSRLYMRSMRSGLQDGYFFRQNGRDMVTLESPAYSGSDEALLAGIRQKYLETKPHLPLKLYAEFQSGRAASLMLTCGECAVSVTGEPVTAARKQPITEENIARQLKKLGDTVFTPEEMTIQLDPEVFYSLGALNELRRKGIQALEDRIIIAHGLCSDSHQVLSGFVPARAVPSRISGTARPLSLTVSLRTLEQCEALKILLEKKKIDRVSLRRIYVNSDMASQPVVAQLSQYGEIFLALPRILRLKDENNLQKVLEAASGSEIGGCLVSSLEGYAYLKEHHFSRPVGADACFYLWNRETLRFWEKKLCSLCLPYELNAGEQHRLLRESRNPGLEIEKVIYGYLPMMVTANCVAQTAGGCLRRKKKEGLWKEDDSSQGRIVLRDRYQKAFPVEVDCGHCLNTIYNSVPLSLHQAVGNWKGEAALRLDFTVESGRETGEILAYFADLLSGKTSAPPPYPEYTTGHEKRGVE